MNISWEKLNLEEDVDDLFDDEDDDFEEEQPTTQMFQIMGQQAYPTLVGPIYPNSKHNIYDYYNLWLMDTDFKITEKVAITISDTLGVEVCHPLSPYKCIIGFGKLFDTTSVKTHIEYALTGKHYNYLKIKSIIDDDLRAKCMEKYNELIKFNNWAMYVFPNGEIESVFSDNVNEIVNKMKDLEKCQELSKGIFLYEIKE